MNQWSYLHKYYFHDELDLGHEWRLGQELEKTASPLEGKRELVSRITLQITRVNTSRSGTEQSLSLHKITPCWLSYNEEDEGDHLMHQRYKARKKRVG